jgi:hypothetical protein
MGKNVAARSALYNGSILVVIVTGPRKPLYKTRKAQSRHSITVQQTISQC